MKYSKFSDAQKALTLKQGAGFPSQRSAGGPGSARRPNSLRGPSVQLEQEVRGLLPAEMKQLEDENAKLRKLVADLALDREMLQDASAEKS